MPFFVLPKQVPARVLAAFDIDDTGVCSLCRAYAREYDAQALQLELAAFVLDVVPRPPPHCVLAFSGGKDSLSTLYVLTQQLRLQPIAVLVDNGFVPDRVLEQARTVCASLGVTLHMERLDAQSSTALRGTASALAPGAEIPCQRCSRAIVDVATRVAGEQGCRWIVAGTNYHASWEERPSAVAAHGVFRRLHLPYAMGLTRSDVTANVRALGAEAMWVGGTSSNCLIPAMMRQAALRHADHGPDLEDNALEVMVGHLQREEALAALRL